MPILSADIIVKKLNDFQLPIQFQVINPTHYMRINKKQMSGCTPECLGCHLRRFAESRNVDYENKTGRFAKPEQVITFISYYTTVYHEAI